MTAAHEYAVQRLYEDQDRDFVVDAIPSLLAWCSLQHRSDSSSFRLIADERRCALKLTWDLSVLARFDRDLLARTRRLMSGRSAQREHVVELAAYALALCAVSLLLPGRRAVGWSRWAPPDILLDDSPGALRGVEVAGRSKGGERALRLVLDGGPTSLGKRRQLANRLDVVEAYVSLWCRSPALSLWTNVKA